MATLNFIMPHDLKEGFCEREEKKHKVKHTWLPSGQSRAIMGDQVALECYCKHCNQREWTQTSRFEFQMLQDYWKELR
jgi:hypothetical protein